MSKPLSTLPLAVLALVLPAMASAQDYSDLPPLAPMGAEEVQQLPVEYRTAPVVTESTETVIDADGVETITRTRRIDSRQPPAAPQTYPGPYPGSYPQPVAYTPTPVVFERDQWIDECRRRTAGRDRDDTGLIIGGLLGAIAGGFVGYELAGAGDRVLGTVLGVGGGGLIGGLIGSLFDGNDDEDRYDCEAALDAYLTRYGTPTPRIASREITYPVPTYSQGFGYPAYGYSYAPPPQMVMVPVRSEAQQQVVVRETVREETYTVPGAVRMIPAPSPKMIKGDR